MFKTRKTRKTGYEDLLQELSRVEHRLLSEGDQTSAMELMVLESQLRERFQGMEIRLIEKDPSYFENDEDDLSLEEINRLIPQDLPQFPMLENMDPPTRKRRFIETLGLAAFLALMTALGIFGLASVLHLAVSWLA